MSTLYLREVFGNMNLLIPLKHLGPSMDSTSDYGHDRLKLKREAKGKNLWGANIY